MRDAPRKRRLLLTAPVLATLFLAAPAVAEPTFVGIWYSAFQPDEPGVMSLIEFKSDGTFYEEFRKCVDGEYVGYQTETGTWTYADGIERTTIKTIDGDAAQGEDTYSVEILTDTERRIRLDDHVFVSHRVSNFEFPHCPTGT